MKLRNKIEEYLVREPLFRERKNKNRGIVNLLIDRYNLKELIINGHLSKDKMVAMVQDYASMDRSWRKTLEERPELRGDDYGEKDELEEKKLEELGYTTIQ